MDQSSSLDKPVIAPCGINCSVCLAYLRDKNVCPGCRGENAQKPRSCIRCIIINCNYLKEKPSKFCYECPKYPCLRLKQLDKRYRLNYHTSVAGKPSNDQRRRPCSIYGKRKRKMEVQPLRRHSLYPLGKLYPM